MSDDAPALLPHEEPMPPRTDLWTAAVFLVFGAAIVTLAWRMPTFVDQKGELYTAPGLVPGIYGTIIATLSCWLAVRSIRRGALSGSLGIQVAQSDFAAIGEEAFVPPSVTDSWAAFAFEELAVNERTRFQFGARFERQEIDPESDAAARADDGLSASLGLVWDPSEDYSVGVSVARSERLPTATELFADGPHVATRAFEIGNPALDTEESTGVDLSLRKRQGRLTGVVNLFANRFDGYIFESFTGEEMDGLQVIRFEQADAEFYGAELDAVGRLVQVGEAHLDVRFGADLVRAELTAGGAIAALPQALVLSREKGAKPLHFKALSWYPRASRRKPEEQGMFHGG